MSDSEASESLLEFPDSKPIPRSRRCISAKLPSLKEIALHVLLALSSALSVVVYYESKQRNDHYHGLDQFTNGEQWTPYKWYTQYSASSKAHLGATDILWNKITPAHGIVAVDHTWAAQKHLPASMNLSSDHSKGVYIIDAYHQLHCLTIVRKTLRQLDQGQPLTYPTLHAIHCFDSIRQYVMCTAGETLLYTWGKNETRDRQTPKCKRWGALSQWEDSHSACYRD